LSVATTGRWGRSARLASALLSSAFALSGLAETQDTGAPSYSAALAQAVSGDLDGAEQQWRAILAADRLHIPSRRALELVADARSGEVNNEAFGRMLDGMRLQAANDLKGAGLAYEEALEFQPGYYYALHNLGAVRYELGDNDDALALYERAVSARSDYPYTHNNLGLARARAGQFDAAIPHYRRALELYPDYHKALNNLGVSLRETGQRDEARAMFVKALKLKPDYVLAQASLIYEGLARLPQEGAAPPDDAPPPAALLAVVETGSPQSRTRAIELLARSPAPDTGPSALPLLGHERAEVRAAAARVFTFARFEPAVAPLIALVRGDEDWVVRSEAAAALGEASDPRAHAALLKAIADKDANVRRMSAGALARYPGCATARALRKAQRDRILEVRRVAEESIRYLGGDDVATEAPDPWIAEACDGEAPAR
jgi:tetratricopeptide (TPR) repeat protein